MSKKITYTLSYPIVLTRACANACGYCRFPASDPGRLPTLKAFRGQLRKAASLGATQIELVAGEGIATDPDIIDTIRYYGFDSYQAYLTRLLQLVEATNRRSHLFSLLNIGPLSLAELRLMRPWLCAMRLMLESADPLLEYREAHRDAPGKMPQERLEGILSCGKAGVPLTTGILLGIGETLESHGQAFEVFQRAHERYRHIQAVRIQMFHPVPCTPMAHFQEISDDKFLEVIGQAVKTLGSDMEIQVAAEEHPHLIGELLDAGVTDLGEISVRRPAGADPSAEDLERMIQAQARARGLSVERRFPIHGVYCTKTWYPGGFPNRLPAAIAIRRETARFLKNH